MPIEILMPALSPTMSEGNLVKWHKKEGDDIKSGQVLAEIETDKATMEIEAVDEGKLGRIVIPEGTEKVPVNALIGIILEEGEDESALNEVVKSTPQPQESQATMSAKPADIPAEAPIQHDKTEVSTFAAKNSSTTVLSENSSERLFATPLARRIASQSDIDLQRITGTGPRGRIIKLDVENYALSDEAQNTQPTLSGKSDTSSTSVFNSLALDAPYESIKLTNIRRVIAQRLTESKQTVPHFYLSVDCEIDDLLKMRQQINQHLENHQKISVNDFVIKAIAMSLRKVPEANAAWGEDHIKLFDRADVSIAVASESGLITPIIRAADQKSLGQIAIESKELIAKARAGKLKPQEFQGGTFSLSNLGMFGIRQFSAIVNPPQGCILAVGAGEARPVVKDNKIEIATVMTCTLSVDHRVVDGAVGAEFLKHFKGFITCPMTFVL
ncbi:MAG: pyruvate dehydrogenase complex dihydrolipoamide acetyltransferase [Janthinobacterium lividum]